MLWLKLNQLKSGNVAARIQAADALSNSKDPAVISALIECLRARYDGYDKVRAAAANALAKIGPPSVLHLISVLRDPTPAVRAAAADALRQIGDRRAIPGLESLLDDGDQSVRAAAASALQRFAWAKTPEARARLAVLQQQFPEAIGIGAPAVAALIDEFRYATDTKWHFAIAVEEALEEIGPDALPGLFTALSDPSAVIRTSAVKVLGQICDARATDALMALAANDPDGTVRWTSEEALKFLKRGQSGKVRRAKALEQLTGVKTIDLKHSDINRL